METDNGHTDKRSGTEPTDIWDALGFVTASQYRQAVVLALADGAATPSGLTPEEVDIAHISHALQELRDEEVVDLLVSEEVKKGRYYGLTEHGEAVAAKVEEVSA